MAGVKNKTMETLKGIGNNEKDQYQSELLSI